MQKKLVNVWQNQRFHKIYLALYGAIFVGSLMIFIHPDAVETANHSYIFLESLFAGKPLDFYNIVGQHANKFYYLNAAHYNIGFYIFYSIAALPAFILSKLTGALPSEQFLWLCSKMVTAALFVGTAHLTAKLAEKLEIDRSDITKAKRLLLLNPIAFFFSVLTGHYDAAGTFLLLLCLLLYAKGDLLRFSLLMSVAVLFKSFALLVFFPLLLAEEKRLLKLLQYAALGLWPTALTALLYRGRNGDLGAFQGEMMRRLVETRLGPVPIFPSLLALLCLFAYLSPTAQNGANRARRGVYFSFAIFLLIPLLTRWHPQWLFVFLPFWVLISLLHRQEKLYAYLNVFFFAGTMLYCWAYFPGHFELQLIGMGPLGRLLYGKEFKMVSDYLFRFNSMELLAQSLFYAAGLCAMASGLPVVQRWVKASEKREGEGAASQEVPLLAHIAVFVFCLGLWAAACFLQFWKGV